MSLVVGQPVPDFTAASTAGEFSLAAARGRQVVLYFYPKDSTPGCTTEGLDFAAALAAFQAAGCEVVGVSRDSLKSHANFKAKQGFPFDLIADTDESLCTLFGVIKLKNMYGKPVRGIARSTFLIGADSTLVREWRGVKVTGHVDEVLAAAQAAS